MRQCRSPGLTAESSSPQNSDVPVYITNIGAGWRYRLSNPGGRSVTLCPSAFQFPAWSGCILSDRTSLLSRLIITMVKAAYELVVGLNKGHKLVPFERKERPALRKNRITKVSWPPHGSVFFSVAYSLFCPCFCPFDDIRPFIPFFVFSSYSITGSSVI